jgi:hypothetical protein
MLGETYPSPNLALYPDPGHFLLKLANGTSLVLRGIGRIPILRRIVGHADEEIQAGADRDAATAN